MIDLRGHASTDTAKDDIRYDIENPGDLIVSFALRKHGNAREQTTADLETVGASDQTHVIFIQSQSIFSSNDIGRRGYSQSRTAKGFQCHAAKGTGLVAHVSWLETAASTEISLTTHVILPAAPGRYMIQDLVSQMDLCRTQTCHAGDPATGSLARCLAETNVKGLRVLGVLTKGTAVLARHLGLRERLLREAKQTSHDAGTWISISAIVRSMQQYR